MSTISQVEDEVDRKIKEERSSIADFIEDSAENYNHPLVKQELRHTANKIREKQHHGNSRKDQ